MPDLPHAWPMESLNSIVQMFQTVSMQDLLFVRYCLFNGVSLLFVSQSISKLCSAV